VLVREEATRTEIRIALPQTGRFADLNVDETVAFGFDPQRAVCFRAAGHGG
jgi:spermidine/putrescine transport system ATP-binding protein